MSQDLSKTKPQANRSTRVTKLRIFEWHVSPRNLDKLTRAAPGAHIGFLPCERRIAISRPDSSAETANSDFLRFRGISLNGRVN